jgi:DNA repair protein RecN (Recombination protein N)
MLLSLRIKNLALVEDLSLEFLPAFNVITGETGAGKSILIGALKLTLGERADRDWIRSGTDSCTVESVFEISQLSSLPLLLENAGLEACQENHLLLKRTFSANGTNRQFVNGSPTTLQILKKIGELLVDMHGPHDHQSLLHADTQLQLLDRYAGLELARKECAGQWRVLRELASAKQSLVMDEQEFQRQLDLLSHQVQEIESTQLQPGEEETLDAQYQVTSGAQKILELTQSLHEALSENENSAINLHTQVQRNLHELSQIDPHAESFSQRHLQIFSEIQDLSQELSRYASKIDTDPERLQILTERISAIQMLKRKYGKTIEEILSFLSESQQRLSRLQSREKEISKLDDEIKSVQTKWNHVAKILQNGRQKALLKLALAVNKQLQDLGFSKNSFSIILQEAPPSSVGFDTVVFQFSPNIGESDRPLREIASSGEMARVMLGLKTALAQQDQIPLLVFDEVDANVGGEIGNRVGEKMAEIGQRHQVLCITHLPQVAQHASHHFVVSKRVEKGRTRTAIDPISNTDRIEEMARMLGGKTEASRKHAREMLKASAG